MDFKRWSDARAHAFNPARTPEQTAELNAAGQELNDYFARAIGARRGRRGDDLISLLVAAEEAGDRLSAREIVRDRGFESGSLQQRVCELLVPLISCSECAFRPYF